MAVFRDERIWRWLTNVWTIVLLIFLVANFAADGQWEFMAPSLSIIYTGILGLYVGTKEFDRWYDTHDGRHPGEIFIAVWTAVLFALFLAQFIIGGTTRVSSEAVADYIMVLSVFALTQKSKDLHARRKRS